MLFTENYDEIISQLVLYNRMYDSMKLTYFGMIKQHALKEFQYASALARNT